MGRGRRVPIGGLLVAIVVIAGFAIFAALQSQEAAQQRDIAAEQRDIATTQRNLAQNEASARSTALCA